MLDRSHPAVWAVLLGAALALAQPAAAQVADSSAVDPFAPTSAPPWSPERPVRAREPWEMVLNAPARLLTLPLSLVGLGARNSTLWLEENAVVPKTLAVVAVPVRYGIYILPATLGDRTGFGLEFRFAPEITRNIAEVRLNASTGGYSRFQAGVGPELARVVYTNEWRPHDRLFGLGLETSKDDASSYSSSFQTIRLSSRIRFGFAGPGGRPPSSLTVSATRRDMRIGDPQGDPDGKGFDPTSLLLIATRNRETNGQTYGVRFETDRRAGSPHWGRGFIARLGFDHFDPEAEPPTTPPGPRFAAFQRYLVEAQTGFSFFRDPRTFRIAARAVDTEINDDTGAFLIAQTDLAKLGGSLGLAGFEPDRFHELDLAVGRLSYLFPLAQHYEMDLHFEAGGVYRDLQNHAKLSEVKTSYGIALRPRTKLAPLGYVGLDWSSEGVRLGFSIGGVE